MHILALTALFLIWPTA